jgi:signal transduction histidine kinase
MSTMTSPETGHPRVSLRAAALGALALSAPVRGVRRIWRRVLPDVLPDWISRFLAVPLSAKLAGANLTIVIAALGAALYTHRPEPEDGKLLLLMATALGLSLVVSVGLVLAALRPLRYLEQAALHVSSGDLGARVPSSALADRNIARIGRTFNHVLDNLIADRARARRLASEVIRAGDRQRALIGRELNESTAQVLAALAFETSALASGTSDPDVKERLETIRALTSEALEHVGMLAQTVHPRVLDDLGLVVAIKGFARRVRETSSVDVDVSADIGGARIPDAAAAMLYRVTEEAVNNAVRHGWAEHIGIRLSATEDGVRLIVSDDGRGFDVQLARAEPGIGLFMMQERASLAGGTFSIESGPATGTIVQVLLPLKTGQVS